VGGNSLDLVAGAGTLDAKAAASLSLTNEVLAGKASSHVETFRSEACLLWDLPKYGCKFRTSPLTGSADSCHARM
jgi:hypothetical protein